MSDFLRHGQTHSCAKGPPLAPFEHCGEWFFRSPLVKLPGCLSRDTVVDLPYCAEKFKGPGLSGFGRIDRHGRVLVRIPSNEERSSTPSARRH
jgi:hypothetical protein